MSKLIDLTGRKFERLRVITRAGTYLSPDGDGKAAMWLCECECGEETIVLGRNLTTGATRSCGCLRREKSKERRENAKRQSG